MTDRKAAIQLSPIPASNFCHPILVLLFPQCALNAYDDFYVPDFLLIPMPKFANTRAWEQAELLMQPTFIRVIDNIGKQLETSHWKGTYQEVQMWADGISEATKTQVLELQQQLETAAPEELEDIQEALVRLPSPHPGYLLCLQYQGRQITVDIWQLCYQICFRNYSPVLNAMDTDLIVEIDTTLIDETGDVDWQKLDIKTKQLIGQIFNSLSGANLTTES